MILALKIILGVYICCSILSTITGFSVINETGYIMSRDFPEAYKATEVSQFCEKPIILQLLKCWTRLGWIPVVHIWALIGFIRCKEDTVIDLIHSYLDTYNEMQTQTKESTGVEINSISK